MIIYTNDLEEAKQKAEQLEIDQPEYAEYVEIQETNKMSFGIFSKVDKGKYVVHNETE